MSSLPFLSATWTVGHPEAELRARGLFRQCVFVGIVLAVWISMRPFYILPPGGEAPASDPLNQVAFSGLAILAFVGACFADRRAPSRSRATGTNCCASSRT